MTDVDVLVVGGGAMGLATAWQLARRGTDVRLVEQYGPGHHEGASHGATRNFNPAYAEPELVELLGESLRLWRELEAETRTTLLDLVGIVSHGPGDAYREVAAAVGRAGIRTAFVDPDDAAERWPGIRFDTQVLYAPDGGRVRADAALRALAGAATAAGARISWNTRVEAIDPDDDGATVRVHGWGADVAAAEGVALSSTAAEDARAAVAPAGDDETIRARVVVVAAGAWTARLLDGRVAVPRLTVTQESPVHFPVFDEDIAWPSFNHRAGDGRIGAPGSYWRSTVYGMLTPGEGVKAGWHRVGPVVDPDARDFAPRADQLDDLRRYAGEWLPGVDPTRIEPVSCTYTSADDGVFVLDRRGSVVVLAGFAGEGFKFVPSIGRIGADLAQGHEASRRFALDRPRSAGGGASVLG